MMQVRHVGYLILTLIISFGMLGAASASSAVPSGHTDGDGQTLGKEISTFMQFGAAETNGTIESGMWLGSNPEHDDIDRRTQVLDFRLSQIDQELAELEEDNMSSVEYHSKSNRLLGQYLGLRTAIGDLENAANRSERTPPGLERLQDRSAETAGEFVGVAHGLPGGIPPGLDDSHRGPPGDLPVGQGDTRGIESGSNESEIIASD